jgi:hypothetical protein
MWLKNIHFYLICIWCVKSNKRITCICPFTKWLWVLSSLGTTWLVFDNAIGYLTFGMDVTLKKGKKKVHSCWWVYMLQASKIGIEEEGALTFALSLNNTTSHWNQNFTPLLHLMLRCKGYALYFFWKGDAICAWKISFSYLQHTYLCIKEGCLFELSVTIEISQTMAALVTHLVVLEKNLNE